MRVLPRRRQRNAKGAYERREIYRTIGHVLWRFRRRSAAAFALLVVAKLFAVLVPVALKYIVDSLSPGHAPVVLPVFLLLGYALLRFASGLFTELRDMVFVRVTQTAVADFTVRVFDHLQRLGVKHHGGQQTGVFARDVSRGTAGVGFLLGTALFTVLPTIIEIVSIMVILLSAYRLGFAAILTATFVVYGIYTVIFTERRIRYQRQLNELDSAASGHVVDSLINYEAIKFYTSEHIESRRLGSIMDRWIGVGLDNQKALSALHVGQSGVIAFGVAAVMLLAGEGVASGDMAVGDLVLVNAYVIQVCLPLNTLGLIFRQAREALINAERMVSLFRIPTEADPKEELPELVLHGGAVAFRDVDFSYEPARQILHGVSLHIDPGQHVAVVGGSGSGKSTLARLLLRFYDVNAGSVTVDGQDVRGVQQASLRSAIGVVPQDSSLFNNTIAYNIAYGRPGASMADVIEAARAARVHELIQSLPNQYDTPVGERGLKLSGGERQRIAIARAVLKNPPILIFDEATSALDTRTERAIQEELNRLAQGRTTLIIAHRLSTVVDADCILVMEQGRIVERGTHAKLLAINGHYAQMWNLQRQQNELEDANVELVHQPINLIALVASVLDAVRPAIHARNIALYPLIRAEGARVTGDPTALQGLLFDIFDNALAFTPSGARMELYLEREGPEVVVAITDNRYLNHDAEPARTEVDELNTDPTISNDGEQADEQRADDDSEVSLLDPLWASSLLEQMGGSFSAHPSADNTGMVFTIRLPLRAVAEMGEPQLDPRSVTKALLYDVNIFVVDDQPEARELLADVLADQGGVTQGFGSGDAVLSALRELDSARWPDVLICDISLGDVDGYRVIGTIRDMEEERGTPLSKRLPAIALSGYSDLADRLRALLAGFQIHIAKPVDPRELLATVLAVLGRGPAPAQRRHKAGGYEILDSAAPEAHSKEKAP